MFNKLVKIRVMKKLVLLVVVGCVFAACKKENDILKSKAALMWRGDYEVDGCGFFVEINSKTYKPKNEYIINESYKNPIEDMFVEIKYKILNENVEFSCGDSPIPKNIGGIEIISIKKR